MSMNPVDTSLGMARLSLRLTGLRLTAALIGLAAASLCANSAIAQAKPAPAPSTPTLNDKFESTFFSFDRNFYRNSRFPRSASWIIGPFVESEIAGDARVTHRLYRDVLRQQSESDPTLRTADLPSPYTSSLMTGSLYTVEPVPPATVSPTFRQQAAPAPATRGARQAPVPALW